MFIQSVMNTEKSSNRGTFNRCDSLVIDKNLISQTENLETGKIKHVIVFDQFEFESGELFFNFCAYWDY